MKKKWIVLIPIFLMMCFIIGILYAWEMKAGRNQMESTATTLNNQSSISQPASMGQTLSTAPISTAPVSTASSISTTQPNKGEEKVQSKSVRFIAVGDIMLGRNVGNKLGKASDGFDYAFEKVSGILKQGDVVFANLESPITASTHGLDSSKKIVLKAVPKSIEALKSGGFNLLSLANNHMLDYYDTGLFDTVSILDKNKIAHAGAGRNIAEARKPAIIEKNGLKIGLISYTDMAKLIYAGNPPISPGATSNKAGVAPKDYDAIRQDIVDLRDKVDIVAVSLHWGVEESFTVTAQQAEFAHKLLDDGADMILGHHPHQFQGIEIYKGKPIFYSMGNFLFDQNDPENMESFILDMTYSGNKLEKLSAIPVRIVDKSHVVVQTGKDAKNILTREAGLCVKLGSPAKTDNDILAFNIDY